MNKKLNITMDTVSEAVSFVGGEELSHGKLQHIYWYYEDNTFVVEFTHPSINHAMLSFSFQMHQISDLENLIPATCFKVRKIEE